MKSWSSEFIPLDGLDTKNVLDGSTLLTASLITFTYNSLYLQTQKH